MASDKLFHTIDALQEAYLSVWEDVCNIESPTYDKAGVDAVGNYFIAVAKKHGWDVSVFERPTLGNVVTITMNPHANAAPITLSGHMDTVHPVGSFGSPAVHRDAEKIYGPGVTDCKGGLVAALMAMDALERCGFTSRPVRLVLQSDEEGGSRPENKINIGYICETSKDSIAFLNLEGSTPGEACLIRKGIVTYRITVTGIEAHSSLCATHGASAIAEAAHKIIELEAWKDAEGVTCNCGTIEGGTAFNTVAGKCTFTANIRFATAEQLAWVEAQMQQIVSETHVAGTVCEAERTGIRVAMEYTERNQALLDRMNEIFAETGLSQLKLVKGTGGSDASDATAAGIPCIDSLGTAGGKIHSREEYGVIASLSETAKRLAAVTYHI